MQEKILEILVRDQRILPEEADKIRLFTAKEPFSLHWELRLLLYLGVLLLNAGLGYLIYQNIDSIGHAVMIGLIAVVSAGCFWYVVRYRKPFSRTEVASPTASYDYIFLIGCLSFLLLEGYLQYQYNVFGQRYGLATFLPMVLFFGLAYRFDNRAVLSMGITALASWLGVTVATNEIFAKNDFDNPIIVNTGIFLGVLLVAVTFLTERYNLKKHFSMTYLNFGVHILMISSLAGMMALERPALYFPILCFAVAFFLYYALTRHSFYFLTVAVVYGYIGASYLLIHSFPHLDATFYFAYFIVSCAGILVLLVNYQRFLKTERS